MHKSQSEKASEPLVEPAFAGAIGKEVLVVGFPLAEKLLIDQLSVQLLMGNTSSSALMLNAAAEAAKTVSHDRRKSSGSKWEQHLLWHLTQQLDQINELIEAIEDQIELLRLEAQVHRDQALELFERADALEDILENGLQEHERSQAIAILRQSGRDQDFEALLLSDIAALLALQLQADRNQATTAYQKGEDCDTAADALEKELAARKREAEELRKELEAFNNDLHQTNHLSGVCLRLKEDLLAIAPDVACRFSIRQDVANQKHQGVTEESYDFNAEEELDSLDLGSIIPPHNP